MCRVALEPQEGNNTAADICRAPYMAMQGPLCVPLLF